MYNITLLALYYIFSVPIDNSINRTAECSCSEYKYHIPFTSTRKNKHTKWLLREYIIYSSIKRNDIAKIKKIKLLLKIVYKMMFTYTANQFTHIHTFESNLCVYITTMSQCVQFTRHRSKIWNEITFISTLLASRLNLYSSLYLYLFLLTQHCVCGRLYNTLLAIQWYKYTTKLHISPCIFHV